MTHPALIQAGLNLIPQALTIYDTNLRLAVCNARFADMFDLPAHLSRPGASFTETIRHLVEAGEYGDIDDPEKFVRDRADTARAFQPHYMERTRANGHTISVEGAPLPQGGWITVYTDITQTKAQELLLRTRSELLSEEVLQRSEQLARTNRQLAAANAALTEARRDLQDTEARTRATTEMMPAHIARVGADGCYTFSNRRLAAVMPGRPKHILGMHIRDTLGDHAFEKVEPHLNAAFQGRASTFEFTDTASSRRIRVAFTPDPIDPGVYILSQDVTEETQSRAALQQTKRREMAAQLTSGLAHDFGNLLTIILGMQTKLGKMDLPAEADPLISATLHAAKRGSTLLHRINDITSPRIWRPRTVHMTAFLNELSFLATPSLPETTTLRTDDLTNGPVLIDPGLVQDALLNLILNARDALGGKGQIQVAAHEVQKTWLQLTVLDDGPGFSEASLAHGIDPFYTTKGAAGSGLGLAMVYDMTKLAGGTARLSNAVTGGGQVVLRLPLRRAKPLPQTGLVLLVEDNPDLRSSVRDALITLNYQVVEASSVAEAQALSQGLDIALVLSDISLEGAQTGLALIDLLPEVPVCLMTSLPPDDPRHIEATQRSRLLPKPFDANRLAEFLGHDKQEP